jgi:hypothetical protein
MLDALLRPRASRATRLDRLLVRYRPRRVGTARQGYDLQLTRYDEKGWRATFYTTGMEHSLIAATASALEPTPWRAVQRAAREALRKASGWLGGPTTLHANRGKRGDG